MTRLIRLAASVTTLALCGAAHADSEPATLPAQTADLTVTLSGLDPQTGAVMVGVYGGEDDYENGSGIAGARVEISGDTAVATIEGLAPGSYGLKLFHDVNGNGELDTNPFGMPTEPYAFSNNAKGRFGPASWEDAQFQIAAGENAHAIAFGN